MKKLLFLLIAIAAWTNIHAQHVVQRGETFELIARRYNITVQQLMEANPDVDECYVGYTLNVPLGAKKSNRIVTITEKDVLLAEKASDYIKNGKYSKATTTYSKAIVNNPSALLYFGRGISYYNREKYKSAMRDFEMAKSRPDCTDEMKAQCERLISTAEKLRAEQHERRNKLWGGITAAVVGAAAVTATAAMANNSSSNTYMPPSKMNGYQRDTSLDYLLDPRLAIMQTQQQEYEEYETFKRLSGANISLDEYRMLKAQANYQKNDPDPEPDPGPATNPKPKVSGNRTCPYCNGKGKTEVNKSVATYGATPYKKRCNECGWEYMSNTSHSHVHCYHCGGTGQSK